MADKKNPGKKSKMTRLVEVRVSESWYARAADHASRLGLPVSTFLRFCATQWMETREQHGSGEYPSLAR